MTRVLWHLSHHSSTRPDGWSGAPDEARYIREDLTPLVRAGLWSLGITMVVVDGDLLDHIEFHEDYDAFVACHYESDTHDDHPDSDTGANTRGGWFWGRAATSLTAAADDRLGAILERRYKELLARFPQGPDQHEDWMTVNVTDYYGFRLTTAKTPGILVELGVGAPGDPNNDHDWLRTHAQDIADVITHALAEFMGQSPEVPTVSATPTRAGESAALVEFPPGEHRVLEAVYDYEPEPSGERRRRSILRKVTGTRPGPRFFAIYPPVDPDDDESIDLDAEPTLFIVNVVPQA